MADRTAKHGCAGALKASFGQLSSCGPLKLSKVAKEYDLATEGREYFFQQVRKDKRDGMNLSC